jgi:hypothetical protein
MVLCTQKSCTTNLQCDGWGKPKDAIFLDRAKAFDKVPKKRLLAKLEKHGVKGNILRWIRNGLSA